MKILVVFYSRSGRTKRIAEAILGILKCDKEEIFDLKNRKGIPGFLSAGTDANLRRLTAIKEIKNNPSLYDLVIIGTPVWSSNISTPKNKITLTTNKITGHLILFLFIF